MSCAHISHPPLTVPGRLSDGGQAPLRTICPEWSAPASPDSQHLRDEPISRPARRCRGAALGDRQRSDSSVGRSSDPQAWATRRELSMGVAVYRGDGGRLLAPEPELCVFRRRGGATSDLELERRREPETPASWHDRMWLAFFAADPSHGSGSARRPVRVGFVARMITQSPDRRLRRAGHPARTQPSRAGRPRGRTETVGDLAFSRGPWRRCTR